MKTQPMKTQHGSSSKGADTSVIPDKLYFRIGEVAHIAGVEPYVLRFWETEFPQLAPKKSGTGHRLFRRKDVELILELKRLLYEKRFTIEGARLALSQNKKRGGKAEPQPMAAPQQAALFGDPGKDAALAHVRTEVTAILDLLRRR